MSSEIARRVPVAESRSGSFPGTLWLLLLLVAAVPPAAHAQIFQVIHSFTAGADGAIPFAGLTMDRAGRLYGTTNGGGFTFGSVYRIAEFGSSWITSPLLDFHAPSNGQSPDATVALGPDGNLYGTTSAGGLSNCPGGGDQGCGVVFKLQPPARVCTSVSCPWTETVLHRFLGLPNDGWLPASQLTFDSAGNIYGNTQYGGTGHCSNLGCGLVFKLSPSGGGWTETVIYNFQAGNDGYYPEGGLLLDAAGNLYGTSYGGSGGKGIVYELSPSNGGWALSILYSFNGSEGNGPEGPLVADQAGNLYGITASGGSANQGTVFRLTQPGTWTYELLYSFPSYSIGGQPNGGLAIDGAGDLYGTTYGGGAYGDGIAFKVTHTNSGWVQTTLHDFNSSDGVTPNGSPVIDSSGNLYGTAALGGSTTGCYTGCGTVWEISP